MSLFKRYAKNDIVELRPVTEFDIEQFWNNSGMMSDGHNNIVHISKEDRLNGSPRIGDFICRETKGTTFAWLIDGETFRQKFKEIVED